MTGAIAEDGGADARCEGTGSSITVAAATALAEAGATDEGGGAELLEMEMGPGTDRGNGVAVEDGAAGRGVAVEARDAGATEGGGGVFETRSASSFKLGRRCEGWPEAGTGFGRSLSDIFVTPALLRAERA